ncbi:hypothetical protein [Streptomyces smaragdinus]|nr:hypothetical protein [Streptomyces smaragdinus]
MPTIIIIVLFTVAIASRQYEFAGALAPLLAPWFARQFAPQRT